MSTAITEIQFKNLLRLTLVHKQDIVTSSPIYLLQKFETLIGDPKMISKEEHPSVLNAILEGQIKIYLDYWKPEFTAP
jgi:hypothetical protein